MHGTICKYSDYDQILNFEMTLMIIKCSMLQFNLMKKQPIHWSLGFLRLYQDSTQNIDDIVFF